MGATDEAHIIRTIEYWDLERTRFPQYEHVAVLVAEDVTSRFLNVVALFNKATQKADRVGFKTLDDGRKVRVFKSNGEVVDA